MPIRTRVSRFASVLRNPILTGGVVVAAIIAFSTAPAHAACIVGGGAAIDGFAVGASVTCPTGTVQAGTVPPDGATITNKNVAGGSTTFTYTTPAVGTVQLAGTVNLTAASSGSATDTTASDTTDAISFITDLLNEGGGGVSDFITSPLGTTITLVQAETASSNAVAAFTDAVFEESDLTFQLSTKESERDSAAGDLDRTNFQLSALRERRDSPNFVTDSDGLRISPSVPGPGFAIIAEEISVLKVKVKELEATIAAAQNAADTLKEKLERQSDKVEKLRKESDAAATRAIRLRQNTQPAGNPQFRQAGTFSTAFRLSHLMRRLSSPSLGANETDNPVIRRPPDLPDKVDAFARVTYSNSENNNNGAGFESKSWQGAAGLDYRIRPRLALGVLTAFTSNTSETTSISSSSDSLSYLAGPFVRFNPTDNLTVSGSFSLGETSTDLTVNSASSSFKSFQTLSTLGLKSNWSEGNWTIAPSANLFYSTSQTEAFTDSAGNQSAEKNKQKRDFQLRATGELSASRRRQHHSRDDHPFPAHQRHLQIHRSERYALCQRHHADKRPDVRRRHPGNECPIRQWHVC